MGGVGAGVMWSWEMLPSCQELEAQFVQIDGLRHKDCLFGF